VADPVAASTLESLRSALRSQYHAGLAMLRDAIAQCPPSQWDATPHTNQFWQIAYHALFFTHLYAQQDEKSFRPWSGHQTDNQNPDGLAGPPTPDSPLPLIPRPYSRVQVLEYWTICDEAIDGWIDALNLTAVESGFPWVSMPKLEHQLVNLRHLQHHTAQLADRLRVASNVGVRWVNRGRSTSH
jgi:hypothetical protein